MNLAEVEVLCGRAARLSYLTPFELIQIVNEVQKSKTILKKSFKSLLSISTRRLITSTRSQSRSLNLSNIVRLTHFYTLGILFYGIFTDLKNIYFI